LTEQLKKCLSIHLEGKEILAIQEMELQFENSPSKSQEDPVSADSWLQCLIPVISTN
jgi:hypothetical protein